MPTVIKSIGTAARDYSTIAAWSSDLDNVTHYAPGDDAIGECYADSDFDELNLSLSTNNELNSALLTVEATQRHDGTANTGVRNNITSTSTNRVINYGATGNRGVSWHEIDRNRVYLQFTGAFVHCGGKQPINLGASNCIFHGLFTRGDSYGMEVGRGSGNANNIVYDIVSDSSRSSSTDNIRGIKETNELLESQIFNNTVYKVITNNINSAGNPTATGIDGNFNTTISKIWRNNIVVNVQNLTRDNQFCLAGRNNHDIAYNGSSDATATDYDSTNSLANLDAADLFVSIVDGSEDLQLVATAAVIDKGEVITGSPGVEIDITGFDRTTGDGIWDMGAAEFRGAAPPAVSHAMHFGQDF